MTHTEYKTSLAEVGLSPGERQALAQGLGRLLADTYTLYLKTHNFHWNVTGPMFATLHVLFEQQYQELAAAVDVIAERIRALEHPAPATYAAYAELSSIAEEEGVPKATDMIRLLLEAHGAVARTLREVFTVAERAADLVTMDLLTQRLAVHEKSAWMLRSLLE
jgi:starvation-inducible DNA-binding protein